MAMDLLEALLGARRGDQGWRADAACAGLDPELFHLARWENPEPARRVCAGCPVRQACLDDALVNWETQGIWGGLGERTRRLLRRGVWGVAEVAAYLDITETEVAARVARGELARPDERGRWRREQVAPALAGTRASVPRETEREVA